MYTLKDITRPSGGFAMLAVDQREAMRLMFAAAGAPVPVTDQHLTDFKVNAAKILSPYASAILVDQQFCYRQIVEQQAVAKSCAMIVAADEFIPGNGIPVDSVVIDKNIDAQAVKRDGGKALKLLVLWRSDEDPQQRLEMVKAFNTLCHSNGLLSIIEPVVRPPRRGAAFNREQAIIDAARELGDSGADLYKVEMPLFGKGTQQELLAASQKLNAEIKDLEDATTHLRAGLIAIREGEVIFRAGEVLYSGILNAGLSDEENDKQMDTFLAAANQAILARMDVKTKDVQALWLPNTMVQEAKKVLGSSQGSMYVRICAAGNIISGEMAVSRMEMVPNKIVYEEGQKIFTENITIASDGRNINSSLMYFLSEINKAAVAAGVMPDPLTGKVGNIEAASMIEVSSKMKELGGNVTLTAYAKQDIDVAGPVLLRLEVRRNE